MNNTLNDEEIDVGNNGVKDLVVSHKLLLCIAGTIHLNHKT